MIPAHRNTVNPPGQLVWPVQKQVLQQELGENVLKQEQPLTGAIDSYKEICRKTNLENSR